MQPHLNTLLDEDGQLDLDKLLAYHHSISGDLRMDAGDDDEGGDDDGSGGDDDEGGDDEGGDDEGGDEDKDKPLGAAGQKALDRMKTRLKNAQKKAREQAAELERLKAGKKDGDEPDAEQIREQARAEARAEALRDRVLDKIEAKAGGRFNIDAEDVAALVLRRKKVEDFLDEDSTIDVEAITEALDELLEQTPSLAVGETKRFKGGGDNGRRKDAKPKAKDLTEAVTKHYTKA